MQQRLADAEAWSAGGGGGGPPPPTTCSTPTLPDPFENGSSGESADANGTLESGSFHAALVTPTPVTPTAPMEDWQVGNKRKTHFSHMWRPLSLCDFPYPSIDFSQTSLCGQLPSNMSHPHAKFKKPKRDALPYATPVCHTHMPTPTRRAAHVTPACIFRLVSHRSVS